MVSQCCVFCTLVRSACSRSAGSDVNNDWTHKDQDKDKDQSHKDEDKDKDLTYKDSKQKRRQAQHSFFKTVSINVFKKH